jgi:hypothetical protein
VLSIIFLSFSLLSLFYGGKFSLLFFIFVGITPLLYGYIARKVKIEKGCILLRSRFVPFVWYGVAKIKFFSQREVECITLIPETSFFIEWNSDIYVFFSCFAIKKHNAKKKITLKMKNALSILIPRGGYLLPISSSIVEALRSQYVPCNKGREVASSLVSFKKKGRVVSSVSFYRRADVGLELPIPRDKASIPLFDLLNGSRRRNFLDKEISFLMAVVAGFKSGFVDDIKKVKKEGKIKVSFLSSPQIEMEEEELETLLSVYSS